MAGPSWGSRPPPQRGGGINFVGWAIGIAVLLLVVIPLFLCFIVVPLAGIFSGGK